MARGAVRRGVVHDWRYWCKSQGIEVNQVTARASIERRGLGRVAEKLSAGFVLTGSRGDRFVDGVVRRDANAMDSHVALGEILARMRMQRGLLVADCEFHTDAGLLAAGAAGGARGRHVMRPTS